MIFRTNIIPSGFVFPYAGTTVPSGYLECNGATVSRTAYAKLFAAIGVTHGSGDGATTFHLPDYRGRFLRGVDGTANVDPDKASRSAMNTGGNTANNVGSVQADQFRSHNHLAGRIANAGASGAAVDAPASTDHVYATGAAGGNETRPVNAYVNYLIKT